ncbi:MAG: ADP-ribosylglycohydrolase family protein, partial [Bdellovibrionales bacterium]|nr:ADP-ribosylglycohydrolase family protein [Bdellovibrionales bacterium]
MGTIVGDALGLPFETLTPGDIQQNFIKTTHYRSMASNPYFKDLDPHATYGTCSDDTQLSLAVMEGIVEARDFELESQVRSHLKQYRLKTAGWGPTTLEAHARLAEGISYRESASETPGRGKGNGVCIQLGPVAAFLSRHHYSFEDYSKQLVEFTEMTHKSYEAICA